MRHAAAVDVFTNAAVLAWGRQGRLVAVLLLLLLLLVQDLKLQELLLLLQETGISRVHQHFMEFLLLVRGDVLMVLQFFHTWFGLFALFAAAFIAG